MANKWIFFDAMGVIFKVGDDTSELLVPFVQSYNKNITTEKIKEDYIAASLGKITSDEFWKRMNLCEEGKEEEICKTYLDTSLTLDDSFLNVANTLKKEYKLAILSNDVSEWSLYVRKKRGIDEVIELSIISGDVGVRKPNKDIYQIAMNLAKAIPSDCIFIDDQEKNLIPAQKLGMKTIKFDRMEAQSSGKWNTIKSFLELEEKVKFIL